MKSPVKYFDRIRWDVPLFNGHRFKAKRSYRMEGMAVGGIDSRLYGGRYVVVLVICMDINNLNDDRLPYHLYRVNAKKCRKYGQLFTIEEAATSSVKIFRRLLPKYGKPIPYEFKDMLHMRRVYH